MDVFRVFVGGGRRENERHGEEKKGLNHVSGFCNS